MQRVNGGLAGLLLSCLKHDTIGTPCRGFQPVSAHAAGCALLSHRQLHFQNQLQVSAAQAQADVPASLVDQIIEFVRNQTQSAQRIDVLRSGLGTVSTDHRKQRARLLLCLAEVESDSNQWDIAAGLAAESSALVDSTQDCVDASIESLNQHTRACLAAGREAAAQAALEQANAAATSTASYAGTLRPVVALAMGALHAITPVESPQASSSGGTHMQQLTRPSARYNSGLQLLAQGRKEEAQNAFAEAAASANKLSAHEGIMRTLLPPLSAAELHAAALAGAGQARSAMGDQEGAEALLSQAVTAAEAVSGEKHVRVAPVLLLLADLYSRTKRITLAEGLYRNAARLLRMDPLQDPHTLPQPLGSHPSLGALLAWRFAQLLTPLSKRESEIAAWKQTAEGLTHCGKGGWLDGVDSQLHWHGLQLENIFGGLKQLQGGDQPGRGFVVDILSRRAYIKLAGPI